YWMRGREKELKRPAWKALMAFSIPHNTQSVFSIRRDEDSIACLEAIRFISFTWVAACHTVIVAVSGVNGDRIREEANYFFSDITLNPFFSVDTFFVLSGLLVSYSFFK
ncbi:hypothetical protein PMAYCL1PPCAC_32295, partial [Pristionchus mayeri]